MPAEASSRPTDWCRPSSPPVEELAPAATAQTRMRVAFLRYPGIMGRLIANGQVTVAMCQQQIRVRLVGAKSAGVSRLAV